MDKDDREIIALRRRIAVLTEEARKNEDAWQRSQRREMELLEADSLGTLFERLTDGLRSSYKLASVTLALADPDHEIRHLLLVQGQPAPEYDSVLFVDSLHVLAPQLAASRRPWLGKFDAKKHSALFPTVAGLQSVALLPLMRQDRVIGSVNLGSEQSRRFTASHATDFLHHLAVIAAFCLENAVNRARLIRSGLTDVLTGWHNRRYLQTRLNEELARSQRDHTPLTCLMIDVDHFKKINDRHGHVAGDEVLRRLAQCIDAKVRDSDVSARFGGEEFVILLPSTSIEAGRLLAERIRGAVSAESFDLPGLKAQLPVTVSIGVAEYRPDSDDDDLKVVGERLIALADLALYEAKAGGRNAVAQAANR
jgi:diguanylate cyclase (GGDEF)-like protein